MTNIVYGLEFKLIVGGIYDHLASFYLSEEMMIRLWKFYQHGAFSYTAHNGSNPNTDSQQVFRAFLLQN